MWGGRGDILAPFGTGAPLCCVMDVVEKGVGIYFEAGEGASGCFEERIRMVTCQRPTRKKSFQHRSCCHSRIILRCSWL